jgi:1-acyl-sn-glycerol-3-phosphate acyltransferase
MWYWIFRIISIIFFNILFRLKVEGLENLPKSNFIIISNHNSYLDALVIMAIVPKKIHVIALRSLYKIPWLRWFLRVLEALPIGSSSAKAIELLTNNKIVGLFPEGGISSDGKLKEFRRGAALLALKTGRPIVPCAILGTYEAFPINAKFIKPRPIKVKIGEPIYLLKEFDEIIDDVYLQEGILKVRNTVKELLNAG